MEPKNTSAHSHLKSLLQFKAYSCSHKESLNRTSDRHKQAVSKGRGRASSVVQKNGK